MLLIINLVISDQFKKNMDTEEFRKRGKEMVDFIADYLENIEFVLIDKSQYIYLLPCNG